MKKTIRILSSVIIGLLLQSCKDNSINDDVVPNASPKIDLTIGNKWTYNWKMFNSSGTITQSTNYFVKVLRDTLITEGLFSIISQDTIENSTRISKFVREQSDGYYERISYKYSYGAEYRDTTILTYKYPAILNSTYRVNPTYSFPFNNITFDTTTISSRNSVVNVSAGTFTCYKFVTPHILYTTDSLNNLVIVPLGYTVTYVADKGIIKIEDYMSFHSNPYLIRLIELKTYDLTKRAG